MNQSPRLSLITRVSGPQSEHFQLTIKSVLEQTFQDWEWILVSCATDDPQALDTARKVSQSDPRVTVVERSEDGHLAGTYNEGLAEAKGEWVILLGQNDLLLSTSLSEVDQAIRQNPDAGYIYTDEDKIRHDGQLSDVFAKPVWSPERLRHQMYLGHLSAMRSDIVKEVGGFREGFDGSEDHDLALRVTEKCATVVHIPKVLYHWRTAPHLADESPQANEPATAAGIRAVQGHLERIGLDSWKVHQSKFPHTYSIKRSFDRNLRVSVIIPTRGTSSMVRGQRRNLVVETVKSLLAHNAHENLEVVIVYDLDTPTSVLDSLSKICGPTLVAKEYTSPFNFSEKCNLGFLSATGDIVVFLNDDMEILSEDFVESLCAPLVEQDVGMTGARLDYSDGRIQHAGVAIEGAEYFHSYLGMPGDVPGYFRELALDREVSGLTAACVALRREVFKQAGGFNMSLPSNFNDVDLSLKLRSLGYRLVWLSGSRALHFESLTRITTVKPEEIDAVVSRWGKPKRDPYVPFISHEEYMYRRGESTKTDSL